MRGIFVVAGETRQKCGCGVRGARGMDMDPLVGHHRRRVVGRQLATICQAARAAAKVVQCSTRIVIAERG